MMKYSIKKYLLFAAACSLTGLLLSGCTSTQSGSLNNSSQAPSSSGSVSSQSSASDGSQSQDQNAGGEITLPSADDQQSSASDSGQSASSSASSDQTSAAQNDGSQSQPDIVTYDEQNQNGADPNARNASADQNNSAAADSSDDALDQFTGTFSKADKSESVALSLDNDTSLSFSFQVCGIHGTAEASGNTAVYTGDDNYTISFAVAGDTLTVTVGGDDAESSAINGTYVRNPDTEAEYADDDTQND